tara:strand:- start:1150 stop:1344 length:195 start_codon:yes stop_codon:yes gene_type:complete
MVEERENYSQKPDVFRNSNLLSKKEKKNSSSSSSSSSSTTIQEKRGSFNTREMMSIAKNVKLLL